MMILPALIGVLLVGGAAYIDVRDWWRKRRG